MADGPDEHDVAGPTPDEPTPGPGRHGDPARPEVPELPELPAGPEAFPGPADPDAFLKAFPVLTPEVKLIGEDDLAWVDKPEISDEERERRRERRDQHRKKVRRKRRTRRALKIGVVLLAVLLVLGGGWFYWTFGGLERMPAVAGQDGRDTPGTNFLLVGDNPAEPDAGSVAGHGYQHAFRASDMVMVLHLTRDDDAMYVISIPGTSVLPIPGDVARTGSLSDAYAEGGAPLFVKTVERYTGLAMDRVAVLDMAGLREITDQLGGVVIDVPTSTGGQPTCGLNPGPRRFDGDQALKYVANFDCNPGRDVDRVQHQQALLRSLMRLAVDGGDVANPFKLTSLLKATASHLTVEKGFGYPSMLWTLFSMRSLRSTTTTFITAPLATDPYRGGPGTTLLDDGADYRALWTAVQQDRIAEFLALNTGVVTQ